MYETTSSALQVGTSIKALAGYLFIQLVSPILLSAGHLVLSDAFSIAAHINNYSRPLHLTTLFYDVSMVYTASGFVWAAIALQIASTAAIPVG